MMVGTRTLPAPRPGRKLCERCISWVPAERTRCPNCRADLPLLPDMVPIEVAPDGHLLSEYANSQLDGVVDPRTRVARLRAIAWDLERSIESGVIAYPLQIEHARAFIRAADQETTRYLATQQVDNQRASGTWLRRGLAFVVIGTVLTVVFAVALGGAEAAVIALAASAIALVFLAIAGDLRFRSPRPPHPERRRLAAVAPRPFETVATPETDP